MAAFVPRCSVCGRDVDMPYRCSYCGSLHCQEHRLPESHACSGADQAAKARMERQRTGHPGVEIKGGWTASDRGRSTPGGGSLGRHEGRISMYLLGAIVGTYVLQILSLVTGGGDLVTTLFVLDPGWFMKPWTVVTSVLAHNGLAHLFLNGIVLFFFGPVLEKRIGSRRFIYLVAAGGVLAGLAQVTIHAALLGVWSNVVGFSGALMAILGTLTILNPRVSVLLFFVVPMPLWLLTGAGGAFTVLAAVLNAVGIPLLPGIAHIAHLTGLIIGLVVGWKLREQGYAISAAQGRVQGGYQPGRSRW